MTFSLLTTKTCRPLVPGPFVRRERLFEKIGTGIRQSARLVLVCAPAGYGKSALLADWAAGESAPVAWLSLDEQDIVPERFLAYLVAAIQRVHPGFGIDLFEQIRTSSANVEEQLLPALVNALDEVPVPVIVTLDDYHTVNHQAIHESLTFLLEHGPPGVTFLIASRVVPPLSLSRLRARRQLVDIRLEDLRFTASEIVQFFNELHGFDLDPTDLDTLEARIEGWPAGLQLAAMALQTGDSERREFIRTFGGSQEYVADYLLEEVLNRQEAAMTAFLMRISVLDRFCAPLCRALTDRADSESILEELVVNNAFVTALDSERHWFRLHHLLADLLKARLQRTGDDLLPELHRKACTWFESNGYFQEAMNHALAGRDFLTVERLVTENWTIMLHQEQFSVTLGWLSTLPRMATQPNLMPEVVQSTLDWLATLPAGKLESHAALEKAYTWALFLGGRLEDAELHLRGCEQTLEEMLRAGSLSESDREYGEVRAETGVLRVLLLYARGELEAALEQAEAIEPLVRHGSILVRGNLQVILGHVSRDLARPGQAIKAYREAIRLVWQSGNTIGTLSAYAGLIGVYRRQARFPLAERTFEEAERLMRENQIDRIPATGVLYLERAALLFELGKRAEAIPVLDLATEVARHSGSPGFRQECDALRSRLTAPSAADGASVDQSALIDPLTDRELEVLALLSEGWSNRDVADKLFVSLSTVKKHNSSILAKLDATSRTQAVARARQVGLL
jgi:LuxR family transcriptional regulator, maltose regulon positive regulatory protein